MALSSARAFVSLSPAGPVAGAAAVAVSLAACSGVASSAGFEHDDRPAPAIRVNAAADSSALRIVIFMREILFVQVLGFVERKDQARVRPYRSSGTVGAAA